ncbi:hypothetical protein RHMOL_Rhmol05G0015700 [Rhododendron molle]|uniref:Uncharacterized protein n=1 Tax=Rhododendron molle TaxID=49168 RepID=A0ACC0NJQ3_RHOML|nr:hypothetical protein RHMOL_Rhmol05G0015700 [Rhododendron molle]
MEEKESFRTVISTNQVSNCVANSKHEEEFDEVDNADGDMGARKKKKDNLVADMLSQKPPSRQQSLASISEDSISHVLLNASKHPLFLNSLDIYISGFKSSVEVLIAFKPRKGKYAAFDGEMNAEEVERFAS